MITKYSLIGIGTLAAGLGCYGAYEQSASVNGGYLMIAAPVVALASAVIPYFAEEAWKAKHRLKAVIMASILIPAAATVFYAASERVHLAKAGAEAERQSLRSAVTLAERHLDEAKKSAARAEADATAARAKRSCNAECLARWDAAAAAARSRVTAATDAITAAGSKATVESPLKMPVWLIPASIDALAFIGIWMGLAWPSSHTVVQQPIPVPAPQPVVKRTARRKPRKQRQALGRSFETFMQTGRKVPENVIPLHGGK
jgi:hypothetical protein